MEPGCIEKGFSPPRPRGVYKRPGLGKKNGRADEGILEDDDDTVGFKLLCPRSESVGLRVFVFPVPEVPGPELPSSLPSIPANDGNPRPARLAKSEFVRLMFPRFPSPLILPSALILGIPPNGSNKGLFFGSNPPSDNPERRLLGLSPAAERPLSPADASEGNGRVDASDDAWLTEDCWPGGLDRRGGRPGPFFLSLGGSRFCRSCGRFPLSFTSSAHLGSTSNIGFSNSHCASFLSCGALLPVIFFPVNLLITETFSSPVSFFQSKRDGSTLGRRRLGAK